MCRRRSMGFWKILKQCVHLLIVLVDFLVRCTFDDWLSVNVIWLDDSVDTALFATIVDSCGTGTCGDSLQSAFITISSVFNGLSFSRSFVIEATMVSVGELCSNSSNVDGSSWMNCKLAKLNCSSSTMNCGWLSGIPLLLMVAIPFASPFDGSNRKYSNFAKFRDSSSWSSCIKLLNKIGLLLSSLHWTVSQNEAALASFNDSNSRSFVDDATTSIVVDWSPVRYVVLLTPSSNWIVPDFNCSLNCFIHSDLWICKWVRQVALLLKRFWQ